MVPISEVEKKIPSDALSLFNKTFNPSIYNRILLAIRSNRIQTFRINALKADKSSIIKELNRSRFKFRPIELIDGAFEFVGNINSLLKSDLVGKGYIYIQSLSSMLPPLVLEPKHDEKILDIAAAPGSKTTQIAALMDNRGIIDAVEPDYIRSERLKYNINILGVNIVNVHNEYGEKFYINQEKEYDRVLVDVPCSGEGRFSIYDKKTYGKWKLKDIKKYSNLQKKILKSAVLSTKVGGIIVYSTCTLNVYENEEVVDSLLNDENFKIELLPINPKYKIIEESIEPIINIDDKKYNPEIKNALRIIPSRRIEGFFICKMRRIS